MSVPSSFIPVLRTFNDFSRKRIKINTVSKDSAAPGDLVQLVFPEGKVSLDTFSLGGLFSTTTTAGFATIGHIKHVVEQVMLEIGSIQIHASFNYYAQVWEIFSRHQGIWAKKGLEQALHLLNTTGSDPTANNTNTPFQMSTWLGFMNSVRVLFTDRLPPVRLSLRLSQPNVLACSAGASNATYSLSHLYALTDMIKVSPVFDQVLSDRISQAPLQIPYKNFQCIPATQTGLTNSSRFSSTADALERVYATFLPTTYQNLNQQVDSVTYASPAFTHGSSNLLAGLTSRFVINGMSFGDAPAVNERGEVLMRLEQVIGEDHDITSLPHPNLNSLSNFSSKFFVASETFSWNDEDSEVRKCGLSALGNNLIASWETLGTSASNANDVVQPLVILETKSVLEIGPSRTVRVIY
jgi:hypothetical protein